MDFQVAPGPSEAIATRIYVPDVVRLCQAEESCCRFLGKYLEEKSSTYFVVCEIGTRDQRAQMIKITLGPVTKLGARALESRPPTKTLGFSPSLNSEAPSPPCASLETIPSLHPPFL